MRAIGSSFVVAGLMVLGAAWGNWGWVRADEAAVSLTPDQRAFGLEKIWSEAKYNFANFDLVPDLDWDKAFQEYLPKAAEEQTDAEYYRLLQRFVALLHDGHTDVHPPERIRRMTDAPPVSIEEVEGRAVIVDLAHEGDVKASGICVGAEVLRVDGRPVSEILERELYPFIAASTPQSRDASAYAHLLRGPKGSRAVVDVRDLQGQIRAVTLLRDSETPEGQRFYQRLRQEASIEMRRFPGGVVYLALNSFGAEQVVTEFDKVFDGLADIKGMIIDLRRNGGGNSGYGDAIIGRLTDKPLAECVHQSRQRISGSGDSWRSSQGGAIGPRGDVRFLGSLVVLTGRHTCSAAENFAATLHGNARAVVVGAKSSGSTGHPISIDLPSGGSARICAKKTLYPDGRRFVGVGIIPDVEVHPSRKDVAAGRDVVLEKALEVLQEKIRDRPRAEVVFKTVDPALAEGDYYRRRGQVSQAIRSYGEALRVQPHAAAAHLRLVDLYREQGNEQKAEEHYQATGLVDGSVWRLIGPFDNANGTALDTPYAPEQGADFTREYAGKAGTVRWVSCTDPRRNGFVDFGSALRPNQWTTAYAATRVDSPEARDVQLRIGSDDEVKVWLNGNIVLNSNVPRYAAPDQDIVPVHLRAGRNDILVKVCNRTGSWGFYMRVTNVPGKPCDDLHYSRP